MSDSDEKPTGEKPTGALTPSDVADTPQIYANGFQLGITNADVNLVLKLDNRPVAVVHMSYTLAKTLHQFIGNVVTKFEKSVGRKMLVTSDVDTAMSEKAAPRKRKAPAKKASKINGRTKN